MYHEAEMLSQAMRARHTLASSDFLKAMESGPRVGLLEAHRCIPIKCCQVDQQLGMCDVAHDWLTGDHYLALTLTTEHIVQHT
jgi:hypothetical protein